MQRSPKDFSPPVSTDEVRSILVRGRKRERCSARFALSQDAAAMKPGTAKRPPRTSELLREFAATRTSERVSIGEIVAALGDRGIGVLIALFAIPNVFPSTVPFGNVMTGVPVILFAVQLMLGVERLILPGIVARRSISTKLFQSWAPRVAGLLAWFERLLRPRLDFMTTARAERALGVLCMILSIVTTLPIPFAHQLPALAIMLIGLGLIERDGLAMLAGASLGAAGVLVLVLILIGIVHGAHRFLHVHSLRHWLKRL